MTKKGPMKKYLVEAEFQDIEVVVSARTEGEARDKVRKRIAKGTLRPKLWPSKYSSCNENPCAEEAW
jgi:hypothetical protein